MTEIKTNTDANFKVEIGLNDGHKWSATKLAQIKAIASKKNEERSAESRLKNEILSLRYRMEEYLEKEITADDKMTIHAFVKEYLEVMNIPFNKFAVFFGKKDVNLKKYTMGERKFKADLATKFANFFHTSPELWLNIQSKNDIIEFNASKDVKEFEKYDYLKFLELTH